MQLERCLQLDDVEKQQKFLSQYKEELWKCFTPGGQAVKHEKGVGDSSSQEFFFHATFCALKGCDGKTW